MVYFEYLTATFNRMTPFKGFDYQKLFNESYIKRTVAFFRISSSSMRTMRFSVHGFQAGLVLNGVALFVMPLRSLFN